MGNHGGKRRGAGRKCGSGKYGEATIPVRVPLSMVDGISQIISGDASASGAVPGYEPGERVEALISLHHINDEGLSDVINPGDTANAPLIGARLHSGVRLIVSRSTKPRSGDLVVTEKDGRLALEAVLAGGNGSDFPCHGVVIGVLYR